ncbi:MAG: ribokinase [Ignavibacteriales bacterium]|nr:ribokinase [Ignavibacteriales bacterium]
MSSTARKAVVVVGSANMDMVVGVKAFPRPGETIFGNTFGMFPGGKGANQAVCCAKLGATVFFIGRLGNDVLGERLSASMKNDGVSLDYVFYDQKAPTGVALITVEKGGQNEIVVVSGSNMSLSPDDVISRQAAFDEARVLLLQLETPFETVKKSVAMARQRGVTVILNPAPGQKLPKAFLRDIDYLTPNQTEAELLTGVRVSNNVSAQKAAKKLIDAGVRNVVITLGKKGCFLMTEGHYRFFSAVKVKAVDTTAAGDAFSAALATSMAEGKQLEESIGFANTVAAITVTRMGAQGSMPTRTEVDAFG